MIQIKYMNRLILIGVAIFYLLSGESLLAGNTKKYVVVLSMDGFRSDYVDRAYTPTLDALASVGVKSAFRPSFPSLTFPNHYSMATGLHPDHHGLIHNSFYAPDLDSVYRKGNPTPEFYGGEPIWNTAETQGIKTAVLYWVGSEYKIQNKQPSIWKPYDKTVSFSSRADTVLSWLRLPEKERPQLIMWYTEQPDAIGHALTPDSEATLSKVEELDRSLAQFFTKARELPFFDQIDFIVLSDHGMATCFPDQYVNLMDYLPRDSFQYVFDGAPTLLYPNPSYCETAYKLLQTIPNVQVWRKEDIPEIYIYGKNKRIAELVVLPDIGTYLEFREKRTQYLQGAHGYDNFSKEMEAIFYAAGPSFKKHIQLPSMENVNLYLLITRLLHIIPAKNDGEDVVVSGLLR